MRRLVLSLQNLNQFLRCLEYRIWPKAIDIQSPNYKFAHSLYIGIRVKKQGDMQAKEG